MKMKKIIIMSCLAFAFCSCSTECDFTQDKAAIERITKEIQALKDERDAAPDLNKSYYDGKIDQKQKEMNESLGNCD